MCVRARSGAGEKVAQEKKKSSCFHSFSHRKPLITLTTPTIFTQCSLIHRRPLNSCDCFPAILMTDRFLSLTSGGSLCGWVRNERKARISIQRPCSVWRKRKHGVAIKNVRKEYFNTQPVTPKAWNNSSFTSEIFFMLHWEDGCCFQTVSPPSGLTHSQPGVPRQNKALPHRRSILRDMRANQSTESSWLRVLLYLSCFATRIQDN